MFAIWEQQPALYASDRLLDYRARAERRASTTLVHFFLIFRVNCAHGPSSFAVASLLRVETRENKKIMRR